MAREGDVDSCMRKEEADSHIDEKKSEEPASDKNAPSGLVADATDEVDYAKENTGSSRSDESQADDYIWGLPWHQFLGVTFAFLGVIGTVVTIAWRWHYDTALQIRAWQKERPRIVLASYSPPPKGAGARPTHLFFSLNFKNAGETTALNTYGAWLFGECQSDSPEECVDWCVAPLKEQRGESYGFIASQGEYVKKFFAPLKTGKARKKQRPLYFCGYVEYADMFCMRYRQVYVVSYELATDQFQFPVVENDGRYAEIQDCHP